VIRHEETQSAGLADAVRAVSDPMALMRRVVDQALVLIAAADGAVVELAHDGQLIYACASGSLAEHAGTRLGMQSSLSGLSVRTGQTLHCQDARTDGRVDSVACQAVGAISMVCVPLRHHATLVGGVLKLTAGRPEAFTDSDVAKLAELAEFISVAIAAISDIARIAGGLFHGGELDGAAPHHTDPASARGSDEIRTFVANVPRPGAAHDAAVRRRIKRVLADSSFTVVCQPIVDLNSGQLLGVEALTRFAHAPHQPPDVWFAEAARAGLGQQLQIAAIAKALELVDRLPGRAFLSINLGPDAVAAPQLPALLSSVGRDRVVLELTEHLQVEDYPRLRRTLSSLRAAGTRRAIDDTGAGFASLAHIVNLAPDLIKLDRRRRLPALTRHRQHNTT
jgi:putative methionine-R-sulfoxide reductase with GAF domain